jgi:leucyl-tRNA synthetase
MVEKYDPKAIEPKWQEKWEADQIYRAKVDWEKPKHYALTMLPYPSGDLHIGHWFAMTPSDARARFMRMRGYNVMFPIGFDAFGLPAEQAAISRNIHPKEWTYNNIDRMRRQLRSMGAMWDWEREAVSCNPEYYHWTEWFFKRFYESGLAYRGEALVNWSPTLQTVLANEQVIDGKDERTGQPVVQKLMEQWFFRITKYADELLVFDDIDWPDPIRIMQTNWIGRSEGAHVEFSTEDGDPIPVYTTRPDTLWGATFMVLAPEHKLVAKITTDAQREAVEAYAEQAARATEIERTAEDREKTGVFTGAYAINPVNQARIPIWIADYVLLTYGSGAIMAVPAHDERDFAFALKFGLPIIPVIARLDGQARSFTLVDKWMKAGFTAALEAAGIACRVEGDRAYISLHADQIDAYIPIAQQYLNPGCWNDVVGSGWVFIFEDEVVRLDSAESDAYILARCKALEPSVAEARSVMEMLYNLDWYREVLYHHEYGDMINSGFFTGMPGTRTADDGEVELVAKPKVSEWLEEKGVGRAAVNYRLRDWLISRQRYWGAPIPMLYKESDGSIEAVQDGDLPVVLPDDVRFMPTGQSPLMFHEEFMDAKAADGSPAQRETDTMDTFMCSSWYWYRYLSPGFGAAPFDPEEAAYWLPLDVYTGGAEHAVMHLLYARFFAKAMRDLGVFDDAIEVARQHGRDLPADPFGEPMLLLRNQGQILGEERTGDFVVCTGRMEDKKLFADRVEVVPARGVESGGDGVVTGEIMGRVENILRVQDAESGEIVTVEVQPDAEVIIPSIQGENNVNQLRHHLEIQRMSKSKGNVVNPDELVDEYGADTVRAYLMFAFDWQKGGPWNSQQIQGVVRWLNEIWGVIAGDAPAAPIEAEEGDATALRRKAHQTIERVTDGLEDFSFNTAIAALMELKNAMQAAKRTTVYGTATWNEAVDICLRLMAPFTPHIAEELWARAGKPYSVHQQPWPEYDADAAAEETITLVVQVMGKVRDRIEVPAGISETDAKALALASEKVQKFTDGKTPRKVIYVAGRGIVNIVV